MGVYSIFEFDDKVFCKNIYLQPIKDFLQRFMYSQQTPKVLIYLCLSEICTRFDVILLTTKVECSLFLELDESITLIWMLSVCVAKKFISILWRTFSRTSKFFSVTLTFLVVF